MGVTKQGDSTTGGGSALHMQRSAGVGDPELSFDEVIRVVLKRRWLILGTVLVFFGLVALYTFSKAPVYESAVQLQIDPTRSSSLGLDDLLEQKMGTSDGGSQLQTEVKIISSDTVALRVIDSLGLAQQAGFVGQNAKHLPRDPMLMSAADRQAMLDRYRAALKVAVVPGSQIVSVSFRSTDPKLATDVANAVVEKYMERNLETRYQGTLQVSNWLSRQMTDLETHSTEAQEKLAEFQKKNDLLGADENDNIVMDRLKLLNQQLSEAEAERIAKEARYRMAATGNPEFIATVVPTLQTLRTQEADLKAKIAQLSSKYGTGYPPLREAQAQLKQLQVSINSEIANVGKRLEDEYKTAQKTEDSLRGEFERQKSDAYKLNEHAAEYAVLKHDAESGRELRDTLQLKLRTAGVTAGLNSTYVSVVDPAMLPAVPVTPRKKLNLAVGLLGGIFLGLLLAFLLEAIDDTVSNSDELERISGLPVLSSIPEEIRTVAKGAAPGAARNKLFLLDNPLSSAAEALRGLRTALLLSTADGAPKLISVASALPGEGKTTVAVNLAIAFAQRGENVLLMDTDLRRSAAHLNFGVPLSRYGVSTVLTQGLDERAFQHPVESLPNLTLLAAGPHPPNPSELLGSKRMTEMLHELAGRYDRIVIDNPPVISVNDALILANQTDATLLVVRARTSRRRAVLRARDLLLRSGAKLTGLVFNGVDMRLENYLYTHGSYYGKSTHEYYGREDKE
ncbi:MAG: polysaccharide biosynthesis tyrosine autokinase [Acidobacteriota bacterium]|nr:polysaccharide biosynthesis tyrosine autokinase [Acidobacteriota bacterium]